MDAEKSLGLHPSLLPLLPHYSFPVSGQDEGLKGQGSGAQQPGGLGQRYTQLYCFHFLKSPILFHFFPQTRF